MNIRKGIKRRFQQQHNLKTWSRTRCEETIFSLSFYSLKWQLEDNYFLQKITNIYFVWTGAARITHLLRLNRGRTDKNIYLIWTRATWTNNYIMWTGAARKTTLSKSRISTSNRWKSSKIWKKFLEGVQKRIIN